MVNVYIWGTGKMAKKVMESLRKDCNILGFIDNDINKIGHEYENKNIFSIKDELGAYDFIILSVLDYEQIVYQLQMEKYDVNDKLIWFFSDNSYYIFNEEKRKNVILEMKIKKLEDLFNIRLNNFKYELFDTIKKDIIWIPKIKSTEEAIKKITKEGCSLIRFGDGEFEQIRGKERAPFQKLNTSLGEKLKEIINCNNDKLLIAIADNYGNLDKYTESVADGIRKYLTEEVRKFHYTLLKENKTYYDAYMFKGYMPYKDKKLSKQRFNLIKQIWENREIILIEGQYTRSGVGNDLFDNAKEIKRILAPTKNAYDVYDKILNEALGINKNKLVLIVLGPAGKCLAYDMFNLGYQVVDIGQVDMDYDWYLKGQGIKVPNPYKYVSQLPEMEIKDIDNIEYNKQIIAKIM